MLNPNEIHEIFLTKHGTERFIFDSGWLIIGNEFGLFHVISDHVCSLDTAATTGVDPTVSGDPPQLPGRSAGLIRWPCRLLDKNSWWLLLVGAPAIVIVLFDVYH